MLHAAIYICLNFSIVIDVCKSMHFEMKLLTDIFFQQSETKYLFMLPPRGTDVRGLAQCAGYEELLSNQQASIDS